MEFTRSIEKSQSHLCCQLCSENERRVKHKCLTCELYLCDRCRTNIHAKIKLSEDHEIVNIRELGIEHSEGRDLDFTNVKCKSHTKLSSVYCETCDEAVCLTCITKLHKKHELEEFQEIYDKKLSRLRDAKHKVQTDENEIKIFEEDMNNMVTAKNINISKVKQNIHEHADLLKRDIDKFTRMLIDELDEEARNDAGNIQGKQTQIDQIRKVMNENSDKAEALMYSWDGAYFFDNVSEVTQALEGTVSHITPTHNLELSFVPEGSCMSGLGYVQRNEFSKTQNEIRMEIVCNYQVQDEVIQFLASSSDGSLWYSQNIFRCILQNVQPEAEGLHMKHVHSIKVYGLVITPSNDILFSTDQSTLKILKFEQNEIMDSHFIVPGLEPKTLHLTRNSKLLVGAVSPGPLYPVKGNRRIDVLNMEGKLEKSYEYDMKSKRLFTHPWGIASAKSGNFCIIDRISQNCIGRLVFLKGDGHILNIYSGRSESGFIPRGVATTPSDNFLVTDCDDIDFTLFLFSDIGVPITQYNTRNIGIGSPFSLSFSSSTQLYIGGTTIHNSGDKAQLYEVNFTDC